MTTDGDDRLITLGRITAAFGVKGWVKVMSETRPPQNILEYVPWTLVRGAQRLQRDVDTGRQHGKAIVAKLTGSDDRDAAEALKGFEIRVRRSQLPTLEGPGAYYWADLIGLRVETTKGFELGRISQLFETGSNDVIVVQGDRERLLPYLWGQVVVDVDRDAGVMRVDWDPDF